MKRTRIAPILLVGALLAACSSGNSEESASSSQAHDHAHDHEDAHGHDEHGHEGSSDASAPAGATEQRRASARLAVTYEGGVQILDATTFAKVGEFTGDGYLRVNPAGDGRHVFLSEGSGFTLLDLGSWSQPHGDHAHFYTADPRKTDVRIDAPEPGHVVPHDGKTVLFSDGKGTATSIPTDAIADGDAERTVYTAPKPHHGVAVERADGSLVVSVGDENTRTGVAILDRDRKVIAQNDQCPGVHGEGAAEKGALVFGCQDGLLVVNGNDIAKVTSPTAGYARIGNVAATEAHRVILGDYKVDKDAKPERPTRVSLVDTASKEIKLVDLPASYSFRSLARGQFGEALVLGTDGNLRIIDPVSGAITHQVKVTEPWTEDANWQEPRPAVFTLGSTAYVSDPVAKTIIAIDIPSAKEVRRGTLEHAPDEVSGVPGASAAH